MLKMKKIVSTIFVTTFLFLIFKIPSVSAQENTVSIWAGEENLRVVRYAAERYNEINGEGSVVLNETVTGAPDIFQRITTSLQAGGRGLPDVMLVSENVITDYTYNFSEYFMNVKDYGFGEHVDKFSETKINTLTYEDGIYGVPFDIGPSAIFYRTDLTEAAGVDMQAIETWDDFIEAAKVYEENTGKKLFAFNHYSEDTLYRIILSQQGVLYFDENNNIMLDSDESKQALDILNRLKAYSHNIQDYADGVRVLAAEDAASMAEGVWYTGTLRLQIPDQTGLWSVIPIPAVTEGGERSSNLGGSSFMMNANASNPQLTYDFMSFFATDPEVQSFSLREAGIFPSLLEIDASTLMENDEYFSQDIWPVFTEQLTKFPPINYINYSVASDAAITMVGKVIGGDDIDTAAQEAVNLLEGRLN